LLFALLKLTIFIEEHNFERGSKCGTKLSAWQTSGKNSSFWYSGKATSGDSANHTKTIRAS